MTNLFSVRDKSAVVTGGSRGIGLMIARGLLENGARVVISSRKATSCDETARKLSQYGECISAPADISSVEGPNHLAQVVTETFDGRLDILINNAGVTWGAPIDVFPRRGWDKVLATNVSGLFEVTAALLPALRKAASAETPARVINIGSVDGLRAPAFPNFSYSSSKAAVHMLTRHLAVHLADDHIRVNAIAPGAFPSDMLGFITSDDERLALLEQEIPVGRIGRPDDITGAVLYLTSAASTYVTGTITTVDGGLTAAAASST
jgi:NAD(P)-dependent dehydrogenase (short-subunit alcohol dehydrogenase family)